MNAQEPTTGSRTSLSNSCCSQRGAYGRPRLHTDFRRRGRLQTEVLASCSSNRYALKPAFVDSRALCSCLVSLAVSLVSLQPQEHSLLVLMAGHLLARCKMLLFCILPMHNLKHRIYVQSCCGVSWAEQYSRDTSNNIPSSLSSVGQCFSSQSCGNNYLINLSTEAVLSGGFTGLGERQGSS